MKASARESDARDFLLGGEREIVVVITVVRTTLISLGGLLLGGVTIHKGLRTDTLFTFGPDRGPYTHGENTATIAGWALIGVGLLLFAVR